MGPAQGMANSRSRVEHPVSAGGVVYRVVGDDVEVVVCGRRSPEGWLWGLPKGTPTQGETTEETAIREVREETGLEVAVESAIGSIRYWFTRPPDSVRYHKTVHFYLMRPLGGSTSAHDTEFDVVHWCSGKEAILALTHQNEVNILKKAIKMVASKPKEEPAID